MGRNARRRAERHEAAHVHGVDLPTKANESR